MPPKVKITKEEILETAIALVRERGEQALNARAIARALDCSTQPVFFNFASMEDLRKEVIQAAYQRYLGFIQAEVERAEYPRYKCFGMAYIRFAKEERELFRLLFMRDRSGEDITLSPDFDASVEMIMQANGVSAEAARRMHLEMWTCVHGIGTMLATSFLSLEWELISEMLSDIYYGVRSRYVMEEKKE